MTDERLHLLYFLARQFVESNIETRRPRHSHRSKKSSVKRRKTEPAQVVDTKQKTTTNKAKARADNKKADAAKADQGWKPCDLLLFQAPPGQDEAETQGYVNSASVKDGSGHEWAPINGQFRGFMCRVVCAQHLISGEYQSPYADAYLQPIRQLYSLCSLFFADFHCDRQNAAQRHKVTLLLIHKVPAAEADKPTAASQQRQLDYCRQRLVHLHWQRNAFLRYSRRRCRFYKRYSRQFSVEVFFVVPPAWHEHQVSLTHLPNAEQPAEGNRLMQPRADCAHCSPGHSRLLATFQLEYQAHLDHQQQRNQITSTTTVDESSSAATTSSAAVAVVSQTVKHQPDADTPPESDGFLRFVEQRLKSKSRVNKSRLELQLEKLIEEYKASVVGVGTE